MSPPPADLEGKYEIVAKLKEGGMGAIYQVRHRLLDEIRVVKVLRPQHEDDDELRQRFAREARAAIRLRHPNIIQIFDFSVDDAGTGLIVMEYIHGADLGHLIRTAQLPSVPLALEITRQALLALGFLHKKGFVHRDVSPDNLMLTVDVDGRPLIKLIDLGIAKDHEAEQSLTTSGSFLGKFRYASPEHFGSRGPDGIEARSDLYTLGLVLYELATGVYPMVGDSTSQLIGAHLFEAPRPFEASDPESRVPPAVRAMILRALEKDAEDRFPDAEAWIDEISTMLDRSPLGATLAAEARSLAEPPPMDASNDVDSTQLRFDRLFGSETLSKAQTDDSSSSSTKDVLFAGAEALFRLGQSESARQQLDAVLTLDPDHAGASALLATIDGASAPDAAPSVVPPPDAGEAPALPPADSTPPPSPRPSPSIDAFRQRLSALLDDARSKVDTGDFTGALGLLRAARTDVPSDGPLVDELTRGVESIRKRIEARQRPPLDLDASSGLLWTIGEIERLRVEESPAIAWRAVEQALGHFGEKSFLLDLRRGLAAELGRPIEDEPAG